MLDVQLSGSLARVQAASEVAHSCKGVRAPALKMMSGSAKFGNTPGFGDKAVGSVLQLTPSRVARLLPNPGIYGQGHLAQFGAAWAFLLKL